ncbi:hypothetical protein ACHQM5_005756 [Ranunculus cassubicifolius]
MAKLHYVFAVLFFLSIFSGFPVSSRTLEQIPKTTVLDVSALFKKSTEILSFNPNTFQIQDQENLQQQSNSSLTVKLYSRDTLGLTPFKNYRDLTLARLKRDAARVNFISKKLNLGNEGKEARFNPMTVETPLISGIAEYYAKFGIGTPAKQFYVAIDTGSDITWIQCSPCTSCYKQIDPIFDPTKSSSYKPLTCNAQQCKDLHASKCSASKCNYQVRYADGSATVGDFATETFTFGGSISKDVAMGCGHDNRGLFVAAAGLLGLGKGSLSFPSQIKQKSFSYCLVDRDSGSASTLSFGSSIDSDAVTTSLLGNTKTLYAVSLTGISVGGTLFSISVNGNPGGPVIVDSGTSITRLPSNIYTAVRDEFVKGVSLPSAGAFSLFDTCFTVHSGDTISVPTVAFHFGAKVLMLPAKNYLRPVNQNTICFAFATSPSIAIIGNFQQQGFRVSFDLTKSVVGFSADMC